MESAELRTDVIGKEVIVDLSKYYAESLVDNMISNEILEELGALHEKIAF